MVHATTNWLPWLSDNQRLPLTPPPPPPPPPRHSQYSQPPNATNLQPWRQPSDKFAALAAMHTPPKRGDTLAAIAAVAQPSGETSTVDTSHTTALLQARMQQRESVWKDCTHAEVTVLRLLRLARETTLALSHVAPHTTLNATPSVQSLARQYRETVAQLHETLQPHAHLVQAYQVPVRVHRLYPARVEERLALERQHLLSDWIAWEQQEQISSVTAHSEPPTVAASSSESQGEKRNRDAFEQGVPLDG
jgi:hypothetical protein